MKTHHVNHYEPTFPRAYVANGLVGLRIGANPLRDGTALVNGYVGAQETEAIEGYAPAPYPVAGDICLDGLWLSQRPDLVIFREQAYDFSNGELSSRFDYRANGITVSITVLTFCCRSQPTLTCQETKLTVDKQCALVVRSLLDPAGLPGKVLARHVPDPGWLVADASVHVESRDGVSTCGAACITEFRSATEARKKAGRWGYQDAVTTDYTLAAEPGQTYSLRQIASLVPGLMHPEPERQAIRLAQTGRQHGFDTLRADNQNAWNELWKGRIVLVGADARWQDIADAAFFYLHSSVHPSSPCSVAAFGLGQFRNYFGHIFWDADVFMLPPLLLTAPESARAMLDYRSRLVPQARTHAALHGYRGMEFPWESGSHGSEVMPAWAAGVFLQQHINLDVAFAFCQYCHATGDELFLRQQAWPVLEGVARWIVSRVCQTKRGYEITHVTGVDEGICNVNNNSYTNMMTVLILREAAAMARQLGFKAPAAWGDIARRMFIPTEKKTGHILKHDLYKYEGGISNPEPLLAYFPQSYTGNMAAQKASFKYYMGLAHTYLGHPVFSALLGVFAARMGDRKMAGRCFEGGIAAYVVEPFLQFKEYVGDVRPDHPPAVTNYITNAASFLLACIYGLPGVQLGPGLPATWCKHPVTMPDLWEGVDIARIHVRGDTASLRARHGSSKAKIG